MDVHVVSAPDPMYAAWVVGCSMPASLSFRDMLMAAQEYDECGPALIDHKCF